MRVALVHDYLLRLGGAERVLQRLHRLFPQAPIFTLFIDPSVRKEHFPDATITASFLDRIPGLRSHHRWSLAALPAAVESFDLRDYDVVISSSSAFIKGVVTRSHARHICYCHTPPRFLWEDREEYRKRNVPFFMRPVASSILHALRLWDQHAAQRVDTFLANSRYTADRIRRYYRCESTILAPPVDLVSHPLREETRRHFSLPSEFFLYVGNLEWWKRPEVAIEAFNRLRLPLVVVGKGQLEKALRRSSRENISFLGQQSDTIVRELMSGAAALIQPQVEDFGIAAVETMAEGTPVIALREGGLCETVYEGISGEFFDDLDPIALADAVRRLREGRMRGSYARLEIQENVRQFSPERFDEQIRKNIFH